MRDTRKLEAGWEAGGRLDRNFSRAMSMRDVGVQGGDRQDIGGEGGEEGAEDGEEKF